jgi:predicted nucleic acid-binding protein
MRVLFDTNIVLDILLGRVPWHEQSEALLQAAREGKLTCSISSLCIANVFYVTRRLAGLEKAHKAVRDCMESFDVLPVNLDTLQGALALPGADFEDNIQIAAAMQAELDGIVTRDPAGFSASPIPAFAPTELMARLAN